MIFFFYYCGMKGYFVWKFGIIGDKEIENEVLLLERDVFYLFFLVVVLKDFFVMFWLIIDEVWNSD